MARMPKMEILDQCIGSLITKNTSSRSFITFKIEVVIYESKTVQNRDDTFLLTVKYKII